MENKEKLDHTSNPKDEMAESIQHISCNSLVPYHDALFPQYEDEMMDDLVESVKARGILTPIIVQPVENAYEILAGHNRWEAAKRAGMLTIPAIVKEGLSTEEAELYVVESNLLQRGFGSFSISEQAKVIALEYEKMFSQGKRNDIHRELRRLEGKGNADQTDFP